MFGYVGTAFVDRPQWDAASRAIRMDLMACPTSTEWPVCPSLIKSLSALDENRTSKFRELRVSKMAFAISLEDHFISEAVRTSPQVKAFAFDIFEPHVLNKLFEIREGRVADLDKGHVRTQVLSSIPVNQSLDICHRTNLQIAESTRDFPDRFAGFACLPMSDPKAAATELEYCIKELHFKGALIPNHASGVYYDRAEYFDFWKKAEELDVVIYLHPSPPHGALKEHYQGNYPAELGQILGMQTWGWHADVAVHIQRLYFSGLFDKLHKLKIAIGHMGEMLPFMRDRIETTTRNILGAHKRGWLDVWNENLWFTTSMFDLTAMSCLLKTTSIDRIMYSVDYPLVDMEEGPKFMDDLKKSGLVNQEDYEKIMFKNAERLLGLKVKTSSPDRSEGSAVHL